MIMKGKWKTRAMAFVMAFSMGMSSMISSSVYAAAEQPETKVETETQVFEEQTEEKVRAEDIVKDVSDKEFRVETSMEGISYDPERESVLLSEIKDQDGGSFQPENPGVYYAQYLVTPKDGSEPYMIGRTITLTDTEGLAHSESNGGEKQKEDTSSEEESEQPLPVEITSSQPEDTPDVLAELERDIEEGNVMMFSAADGMGKSETVHLNKGRTIYYPDYLGNYLTCLFTVNGKLAYCLESHRASPPTGDYVADILESNKNLQKVLYYGYGGAGDITGSYLSGKSDDEKYVYTHLAASYAYCGDLAFTGCPYENLVNAGVIAYINHLFGMEEPPKGELSFSNANVTAVREGDIQKTPDITLNGDHRNKITIPVPQGVTGYNKSKGTNVSGGNLEVYGGDTFYLQAPLTVTGKWESGQLYGSVRESWKTLVLTSTGGNNQDIGAFISEKAAPVSFDIQWLNLARVKILKKDAETGNPLDGAVYGVYKNSTCTDQLLTIAMTGEDGISYSDYFDAALETVYVKEITAPNGYAINKTVYPVHVSAGSSVEVEAVNTSVKGKITVKKQDVDTGDFLPQGDAKLDGAVYGLYAKEDIQKPDGTGVLYKAGSLIQEKTFGKSGEIVFENVYLGAMYVKEIAAPEGYLLDETEYDATLIYEGQEKPIVVKALTVKEKVKKQAFQIIKISEDGDQTETDLVEGAEFTIYLVSNDEFSDKQALNYIQEYAKMFDLDEKSGIELTESKPKITDNYAIPSAIGQGTNNFSTVQLGRYVTTLANEGTSFQLSLIDKIDGVETSSKVESQIEINKRSWEGVHAGMELYAQSTGIFDGFPISVAGKSGTAQEVKNRPDHGLFIGYAPADDPEIAVAVRIVNGYEAGNAVECGKNIFEYYFGIE